MTDFTTFSDLRAACFDLPSGHPAASAAVTQREDMLTKPPQSLGRLEDLVAFLAHWQGHAPPRLDRVDVLVFAGNHGVTAQGVSAYPAEVTVQMVANFSVRRRRDQSARPHRRRELARHSAQARRADRRFHGGAGAERARLPRRGDRRLRGGGAGRRSRLPRRDGHRQYHGGGGDRGGACSAAAARAGPAAAPASTTTASPASAPSSIARSAVTPACSTTRCASPRRSAAASSPPFSAPPWRRAATTFRSLLDGFVCTAAVAPLYKLRADTLAHALAAHVSAEAGHRMLLDELGLEPLVDLNMRLGEASGAALGGAHSARRARLPHRHGDLRRGRRLRQAGRRRGGAEGGGVAGGTLNTDRWLPGFPGPSRRKSL